MKTRRGIAVGMLSVCAMVVGCTSLHRQTPIESEEAITSTNPKDGRVEAISLIEYLELQQAGLAHTYDVRPAFFHSLGRIPGSISWPKSAYTSQLATREQEIIAAKNAGKSVIIYCTDTACPDARTVADRLADRGHHTHVLHGGWDEWKSAGLPH